MNKLYLSYINLTPGIENKFSNSTHKIIMEILRKYFYSWDEFSSIYPNYGLGIIVVTKKDIEELNIKGPTIDKKRQVVDFSIFLPTKNYELSEYINLFCDGMGLILKKLEIKNNDIELIKREIKIQLE